MNAHIHGIGRVSTAHTMRGPGDFDPPCDKRADVIERIGEEIERDADKVRDLVLDAAGLVSDPMYGDLATDLTIALRELRNLLDRLCNGDTLQAATKNPDEAQHFRVLLRASKTMDAYVAKLIDDAAAEKADEVEEWDE